MTESYGHKPQLLIVDDTIEHLHTMMDILRDEFAVIVATDGEKALRMATDTPSLDLILLDIRMPGMDGYEVLRRLKADPKTADIPVIFVTALSEPEDESRGLGMGAVDYVTKPINPDLLKMRVRAQVQLRSFHEVPMLSMVYREEEPRKKFTVLVVDDNVENLHELVGSLSEEYLIRVADNGPKAIKMVHQANPPDLILLDIRMPDMDGYEVCKRIKKTEVGLRIPVIFVSVLDEADAKIKGFSLGAADYITKPFDIDEARARIRSHIHLSRLRFYFEQQLAQRTAALLAMTNRMQATLDAIPDVMIEFDAQGHYLAVSPRYEELLPEGDVDPLGKSVAELLPEEAAAVHMSALHEAEEDGVSHGRQFELASPGGSVWFELSISRLDDHTIPGGRFVTLARDISDRKRAEQEELRSAEQIREAMISIVKTISLTLEMRDPYTAGHQRRVADLSIAIGQELGMSDEQLEGLRIGANLHDIGKIQLPVEILTTPRKLTELEYEFIKTHSQAGADILADVEFPWPIREMILQHHERLDGSGYPQGIMGDEIIFQARILAVADVVEAMSSHRPYRPSLGIDAALEEIERGRGIKFDPQAVDSCVRLFREKGYLIS